MGGWLARCRTAGQQHGTYAAHATCRLHKNTTCAHAGHAGTSARLQTCSGRSTRACCRHDTTHGACPPPVAPIPMPSVISLFSVLNYLNACTIASASSSLRVTTGSFQLAGRRLPLCFTSRCDARTCCAMASAVTNAAVAAGCLQEAGHGRPGRMHVAHRPGRRKATASGRRPAVCGWAARRHPAPPLASRSLADRYKAFYQALTRQTRLPGTSPAITSAHSSSELAFAAALPDRPL